MLTRHHLVRAACRLRHPSELLVLLTLGCLVGRTWLVEGLLVPLVVPGGSMAETLLGVHREVVCRDCGRRFVCGADLVPVGHRAVCPNCGYAENDLHRRPDVAGDRLLVHKSLFQFRTPRRWEVVVLRHPRQAEQRLVKRVVGLPGESIQIRGGNVYVDGQIQRKPFPLQRSLAVPVYDASHPPSMDPSIPTRWQPQTPDAPWGSVNGRFAHPELPDNDSIDWLDYYHWRRVPGRVGPTQPAPITDICGYNQSRPRRTEDVSRVNELLLSFCLVKTFGRGRLLIRASDARDEFLVEIDPQKDRFELRHNCRLVPQAGARPTPWTGETTIEVSLFDQQLVLAFDGRPVVIYPYEPSARRREPGNRTLSIGSQGLGVEIRDLRVYRDIYYTHPPGLEGRWGLDEPVRLASDEYFVLGDNSSISEDSRIWPGGPAVPARLLVGKPLLVYFPARRLKLGRWDFQVPDPARIRYIQ